MEERISEFLLSGVGGGWSASTAKTYGWHIRRFAAWCALRGVLDVQGVNVRLVREWSASLTHWGPSTRRGALTALRSFLGWCSRDGLVDALVVSAVQVVRVPWRVQRTVSPAEVKRLLTAAAKSSLVGVSLECAELVSVRNVAIVALLYDSMLRASELCGLRVGDVDLAAGVVVVRRGKGGAGRLAPFGPECAEFLQTWLAVSPSSSWLFVALGGSCVGRALTASGLRVILRRLGERAGVCGVSPHTFRRGGAVAATLNGAPSRLVQLWGGWSDIRRLEDYTRRLVGASSTAEAFRAYSPLSGVVGSAR